MTTGLQAWFAHGAVVARAKTDEIEGVVAAQQVSWWQDRGSGALCRLLRGRSGASFSGVSDAFSEKSRMSLLSSSPMWREARGAKWLLYLTAFAVTLGLIGLDVGWVAVVSVVVLVVVVLMVRPMIENTAAGLVLAARPAFGVAPG